jgi:zinc transporter ZupT
LSYDVPRALTVADPRRGRRIGTCQRGGVWWGWFLGLVGLLLVVAGVALPEGVRSKAIHILAVGFFAGAFVF